MARPDLNLLVTLDVLLQEGSVTRAGERLALSPSAMSRALARLRRATGDPLLVRAGRGLVPTPRALELRDRVRGLVQEAEEVLRPAEKLDLATLERTFALRGSDGFVESFGPALVARVGREAPGVRLRFLRKTRKDATALRNGTVDLETGVIGHAPAPDVLSHPLFTDRFIGVVRGAHPLSTGKVTTARYASARHVHVSRRGLTAGLADEVLRPTGRRRHVVTVVDGFSAALALANASDLVATVPERHTAQLRQGMCSFELPFRVPEVTVSLLWHVRLDADPAHRWLRGCVLDVSRVDEQG
ncbi:DNA-binding transcriptional LysR family regulator [Saccharothrix tamanrassetensis]|uniref:DNA-binding transcriptional LysR family regulator n=1 Tax=Saccharothrix tamanrassetensis TaxID=1051531 RepID=A0A841CQV1_9PSEU|nr:LysR family transcriptional regulator [Saccharothrix tamanrassetensis]MBB5959600.1 DNA-binding transcriptional LysR family regulator [Saccharothrix tamanrassetensis]